MPVWTLLDLGRCLNMKPETRNSAAFRSTVQVVILSLLSMNIKRKVDEDDDGAAAPLPAWSAAARADAHPAAARIVTAFF